MDSPSNGPGDDRAEAQAGKCPPAVSVLMPVRNAARFLGEALESLASQTFCDFEIVAVDNGSADATFDILVDWARSEPRLRPLRLGRPQLAAALNYAASVARAPLLARLDGDDIAYPGRLAAQLAAMEARPGIGLLGSAAELIDGAGRRLGELRPPQRHRDICARQRTSPALIASSTVMRANVFHRIGGYRTGLNVSEDFDLYTRMSEHCELANLDEILIGYRIHGESISARQPVRMALASVCVTAAAEARRRGVAEPFSRGTPNLRLALSLLGTSRRAAWRLVRLRSAWNLLSRWLLGLPVPAFIRRLALRLVRRAELRSLYLGWLLRTLDRDRFLQLGPVLDR
ncbi:MAG: glycosyl transferase, family 2 [Alphaproteobacteria bacterium]|nr:glycosyl transferase, family 2 [Alphaproteobacteria bacterium]